MKRGRPLRQGGPLRRATALERGAGELKRTELRRVSPKRAREHRERKAMVESRWPGGVRPRCIVPWCTRLADDVHEPLTRARGGSITDPDNTVPVCRGHNEELTLEPAWGYALVLLVGSADRRPLARLAAARRVALANWSPERADLVEHGDPEDQAVLDV